MRALILISLACALAIPVAGCGGDDDDDGGGSSGGAATTQTKESSGGGACGGGPGCAIVTPLIPER